jgi:membrane protein DedA with SNARE-associated domain
MGRGLSNTGLGKFIKKRLPGNDKLEGYVGKNSTKLVFLSKFIYSTTFVIIFSVGWAKMEFRRFMKTSITAILGWIPIMVGVSYGLYSSFSLIRAKSIFHQIEIFFIFGIIAFIIMDQIISWIAKRFFAKEALEQQPPRKG